jgi:DNA replication protein
VSEGFNGFPGVAKATAIPNLFFAALLPEMERADELLAFLYVSRITQDRRGDERFASEAEVWAFPGAARSFERMGGGREGLALGLDSCIASRSLVSVTVAGEEGEERLFLVNNPASRRTIARARSGQVQLRPAVVVVRDRSPEERANIFRLYEEHIGTITPLVGDRLLEAEERYPADWVEDAFREAAELNHRSWRYIERILQRWAEEGRAHETAERDPLEDDKQRYLGGFEHIVRYR